MKHKKRTRNLSVYRPREPLYPNAADTGYFTRKLLDILTAVVSGIGFTTAMVFLVTLT